MDRIQYFKLRPNEIAERQDFLRKAEACIREAKSCEADTDRWYQNIWNARLYLNREHGDDKGNHAAEHHDLFAPGPDHAGVVAILFGTGAGQAILRYFGLMV